MRTIYPVMVVLCLGTAALMLSMSGFGGLYGPDPTDGLDSDDELQSQASNSSVDEDGEFGGPSVSSGDGDIVGLIISGLSRIASLAAMVVLLPLELRDLGFPWWFAMPVGLVVQTIVGIGLVQFASGRVWR
jgi:hypothetical protein